MMWFVQHWCNARKLWNISHQTNETEYETEVEEFGWGWEWRTLNKKLELQLSSEKKWHTQEQPWGLTWGEVFAQVLKKSKEASIDQGFFSSNG